ncbi:hypothetical protein FHR22_003268 [Sphingopyxis panaciterrae]|nr:hypothetical protein [Sphingopyxis panaciterrae]
MGLLLIANHRMRTTLARFCISNELPGIIGNASE